VNSRSLVSYYEDLLDRVGQLDEDVRALKKIMNILGGIVMKKDIYANINQTIRCHTIFEINSAKGVILWKGEFKAILKRSKRSKNRGL